MENQMYKSIIALCALALTACVTTRQAAPRLPTCESLVKQFDAEHITAGHTQIAADEFIPGVVRSVFDDANLMAYAILVIFPGGVLPPDDTVQYIGQCTSKRGRGFVYRGQIQREKQEAQK